MAVYFTYRDNNIYVHHSYDRFPDPENFQMHTHDSMELYYFIAGNGKYAVEGNVYDIHPHDILIFRSGEMHMLLISPDEPYERLTIHFSPELFSSLGAGEELLAPFLKRELGQHNLYPSTEENLARRKYAYRGMDAFQSMGTNVRVHILSRLLFLLVEILDEYSKQQIQQTVPKETLSSAMIAHINAHLFDDISLESVCRQFYLSKSQANRVFRVETGHSIWNYVVLKRLIAARERLQNNEPAGKVCIACGFKDYSSFYRAYRNHFGVAPSEASVLSLEEKII